VLPVLVIEPWTREAPEKYSDGTRPTKEPMVLPVNLVQSPISTASANPVNVETPLRAPNRRTSDRVKTDAKDAIHLARLLRLDEVTAVVVPSLDQEAARDLVRAREDARGDLMRARHRLSKLLLGQGIVYSGGHA